MAGQLAFWTSSGIVAARVGGRHHMSVLVTCLHDLEVSTTPFLGLIHRVHPTVNRPFDVHTAHTDSRFWASQGVGVGRFYAWEPVKVP